MNSMIPANRRGFMSHVGRGMLAAGLGTSLANDLGFSTAFADEGPETIPLGDHERLVEFLAPGVRDDGQLRRKPLDVLSFLGNKALGDNSVAMGLDCSAIGISSIAMGQGTSAIGISSTVQKFSTV